MNTVATKFLCTQSDSVPSNTDAAENG